MEHSYDKIIDIVYDINQNIYDILDDKYILFYLKFESDGFTYNINIGDFCLFSSEDSHVEWNSEEEFYIKLKNYLIQEINKLINAIGNIKI